MIAKQLSRVLDLLIRKSDVSADSYAEMEQRFESLRNFGRHPRGRENRGRALTDEQIATAVFGLVPFRPGWAGHGCAIIERLLPVGGPISHFNGAASLSAILVAILSDPAIRASIIAVRLSVAETGTNSHGGAEIVFQADGVRQTLSFVPNEAVSLLQPGTELTYDTERRHSPVSRELALNRHFFDRLSSEVAAARARPSPPIGDGSEYNDEDAERARRDRIGATASSRYLNLGVDNQVTWPDRERLIAFDRYKLVLMPKTKKNVQSAHIDLAANGISCDEAKTVINRMLSVMTWCDDQFAIAQDGWSGNPVPVAVPKRNLSFSTTSHWLFNRGIPATDEGRRALALYREARNAEQNFIVSYAVLNYYKIIEIRHAGSPDSRKWVADNLPTVLNDHQHKDIIKTFLAACGEEPAATYIYAACRVAVAHVSPNRPSDPDDAVELRRLHNAAHIMRLLAKLFISSELGISDIPFGEVVSEPE